MIFTDSVTLNTQVLQETYGKPFYDDFESFFEDYYNDALSSIWDTCIDKICEYYGIWKDLNTYDEILDLADKVSEELKDETRRQFNRIKDMTDDIDFDSAETPYIEVEVPSEDNIYDEFLNQCESEDILVDLFEEISDILCYMLSDVYPSGKLSDSEEEYLMQNIDETVGESPDEMMDIAKAHNLAALKAFADKKLEEYHN